MKVTRQELYDLVWAEPMTTVAKRFGLSDNGLRKQCKSMNIPTPPLGYWAKLQYGKTVEKIPLPTEYQGAKQHTTLHEVNPAKLAAQAEIDLTPPVDPYKEREKEISAGDTSCFIVPEALYAKDPIIIDTKEKLRRDTNRHLQRNPYKSKRGKTLDIWVYSDGALIDRALCIFSTIIRALRHRNHSIAMRDNETYAVVAGEEIRIDMKERTLQGKPILSFRILYSRYSLKEFKDTTHTRVEDKIISIITHLEMHSEWLKERRRLAEIERIKQEEEKRKREEEERKRKEFEAECRAELKRVESLFKMAERLHKANIIRHYISTYERHLEERDIQDEEMTNHLQWAREKADWLDPFISSDDELLRSFNKDNLFQPDCPKDHSRSSSSYQNSNNSTHSTGYNFWATPWWKKTRR